MLDKNPFSIKEFKGVNMGSEDNDYSRFTNDAIPFDHALDALNISYLKEGGFRTRPAWKTKFDFNGIVSDTVRQYWKIARLGTTNYTNRWLILTYGGGNGMLYDLGSGTPSTPILTKAGMNFCSVVNIFGRLYISPLSEPGVPLAGESIYLYDGTNCRTAGGSKGTVGSLNVASGGSGNVTAGLHLAAFAFETDSGFITPPIQSSDWIQVTITAGQAAQFTNIPIGPTGTVARHLLLTHVIGNYDNVPENWELFFGLRIGDNTTTSGDIIVPDTGLNDSADYLLDEFETLPSCAAISIFNARLMYNGPRTDQRLVYVSNVADPETIDQTEAYLQIPVGIPDEVLNGKELRGIYYIFKDTSTFTTRDNGGPANTWEVDIVDSGLGLTPWGIAEVYANPGGLVLDNLLVANTAGLYVFSGTFSADPISRKIQPLFRLNDRSVLKYTRLAVDSARKLIYLLLGPYTQVNDLWVGDYTNGLDAQNIKWARWTIKNQAESEIIPGSFDHIVVDPNNGTSKLPSLTVCITRTSGWFLIMEALYEELIDNYIVSGVDNLIEIDWEMWTGFPIPNGFDYTFDSAYIRASLKDDNPDPPTIRDKTITIAVGAMDNNTPTPVGTPIEPGPIPGRFYNILLGLVAPTLYLKVYGKNKVQVSQLTLMVSEREKVRSRA